MSNWFGVLTVDQCTIAMVGCLSAVRLYVKVLWSTLRHMLLVTLRNAAYCLVKGG